MDEEDELKQLNMRVACLEEQAAISGKELRELKMVVYKLLYEMGGKELMEAEKPPRDKMS